MGGSVFGLHRRERITFCENFGGARLGRLKEGLGRSTKNTFPPWHFGLHRRERIVFLGKFRDARRGRLKEGLGRSKKTHLLEKM